MRRYICFYRSIGENKLLKMERIYFGCGDGGDASGGAGGDVVVVFGVNIVDIRLLKRNKIRASDEWCMLLSLNP
jgi:hypothetical protein